MNKCGLEGKFPFAVPAQISSTHVFLFPANMHPEVKLLLKAVASRANY